MTNVFTVGHGTRTLEDLTQVLRSARISVLVDVRRFPGSRRNPHFARASLERTLPDSGIDYEWWGEELGGRRPSDPHSRHLAIRNKSFRGYADFMDGETFRSAMSALERLARSRATAVMCSETLWWRCHRRHIADVLTLDGFEVTHLLEVGKSQPHTLHPALRTGDDGRAVYDVNTTQRLIE